MPGLLPAAASITGSELGDRILKVNHAGEHGAVNIYAGQILMARFTDPAMIGILRDFKSHEERHRELFRQALAQRDRPRCRSYRLCGFGGLMLGLVTGLFGRSAIAATTVAVERVVLRHLEHQMTVLREQDRAAAATICVIVSEEQQHHDTAKAFGGNSGFWDKVLAPVVSWSTESVIWLGMRL
jgi:3-demethoxyubiquinol 3-hydroxylase